MTRTLHEKKAQQRQLRAQEKRLKKLEKRKKLAVAPKWTQGDDAA